MPALYNELDPYAAQWLRNLSNAGHIAPGVVDDRSIVDLRATDVAGPGQRHFFAGVGAWSYALRLAGVSDDADVWTGSCPCQPFSVAGKRRGADDERHLWPVWFELIAECRPAIVLGEQVASRDGRAWLAAVRSDLESVGYRVGAADLCAAGVGAPHIRQRIYFVAYAESVVGDADSAGLRWHPRASDGAQGARRHAPDADDARSSGSTGGAWSDCEWIRCRDGKSRPTEPSVHPLAYGASSRVGRLRSHGHGNAIVPQVAAPFIRAALGAIQELGK